MSPWTLAFMDVICTAQEFANAWEEFRGNPDFTREVAKVRRKLEMVLAIYRTERRKNIW